MSVSARETSALLASGVQRSAASTRIPTLPREFYVRSPAGAFGFIAFVLSLWLVPGALATWLAREGGWPWWALVPALAVLCFVAGQGLHLTGWVGHEGFHFNLFRHRVKSAIVGVIVSSASVVFLQSGVAIEHFNHHRYANTERDPDVRLFSRQEGFWARLFLTRTRANRAFFSNSWRLVRGLPLEMDERGLPLSRSTYERLARLNLICCLLYLCSYAALFVHDPLRVTCSVILPLVFANLYSGIRPYLEHSNTDDGLLTCARSRTHWLFVSFYYGNSLHLEHHLYPSVPCYRLPRVHRWLVSQGFVPASHPSYEPRGLSSFRWAVAAHAYGARDPLSPRSAR